MHRLIPAVILILTFSAFPLCAGEVGTNDFRISIMGTDGDTNDRGELPRVAYNATTRSSWSFGTAGSTATSRSMRSGSTR